MRIRSLPWEWWTWLRRLPGEPPWVAPDSTSWWIRSKFGSCSCGGKVAKEQPSSKASTAAKVLAGKKATPKEARRLAGSVLGQDEKKGQGKKQ